MEREPSLLILGVAALAVAFWLQMQVTELQRQLGNCSAEYQGFKDGVIYGN